MEWVKYRVVLRGLVGEKKRGRERVVLVDLEYDLIASWYCTVVDWIEVCEMKAVGR